VAGCSRIDVANDRAPQRADRPAPHANTYDLTPDGLAFAIFYTKVHDRVLAPLFAIGQPQAPPQLRAALTAIQGHIDDRLAAARLPTAA
jgi:hypothetical protein